MNQFKDERKKSNCVKRKKTPNVTAGGPNTAKPSLRKSPNPYANQVEQVSPIGQLDYVTLAKIAGGDRQKETLLIQNQKMYFEKAALQEMIQSLN